MEHIVKRRGHLEQFDEKKVYASVYAALLITHVAHEISESLADKVTKEIKKWISRKKSVTSDEIFIEVAERLKKFNKEAAFMYATHRDIC